MFDNENILSNENNLNIVTLVLSGLNFDSKIIKTKNLIFY